MNMTKLTFDTFQTLNAVRCAAVFHEVDDWPVEMWALAVAGEAGELANLAKKVVRGDFTIYEARDDLLREVADVITYCDLLTTRLGASTADTLMGKFDEVSARYGYVRSRLAGEPTDAGGA